MRPSRRLAGVATVSVVSVVSVVSIVSIVGILAGCFGSIRDSHYNRGVDLQSEGKLAAAARAYHSAIEDDPEDALAHYNLGTVYHRMGKLKRARASYETTLHLRLDPRARINIAAILEKEGKPKAALAQLDRAAEGDTDSAYPLSYRGFFYERQGKRDEAMADYRAAIEREEEEAYPHFRMGKLLWMSGRIDEALTSLKKSTDLDTGLAVAWKALGDCSRAAGKPAQALRAYSRLSTLEPDEADHLIVMGELYLELRQTQLACRSLWRARGLSGANERIRPLLLKAYRELLSREAEPSSERASAATRPLDAPAAK